MKKTRIVILGAGFGGISTYKALHKQYHKSKQVELVLVNDTNYFLFTPLLHEVATGGVHPTHIVEPIRKVLQCCLKEFHVATVERIETQKKRVHTSTGSIAYDYLVVALGSETTFFGVPGAEKHCFTLKTLPDALTLKHHVIDCIEAAALEKDTKTKQRLLRFTIVGGGPTGVELAAELAEFLDAFRTVYPPQTISSKTEIVLVQSAAELLPAFAEPIRRKALHRLTHLGVRVLLETAVKKVENSQVHLSNGEMLETQTPIWVAGIAPKRIPFDVPIKQDARYRLHVDGTLELEGHPNISVIGDMAYCQMGPTLLPALAQVASQQGPVVARNISARIAGKHPTAMHYHHRGSLVSLGQWMAAGEIGGFTLSGRLTWWLWRTVYVSKLISWRKRIAVVADWTINLFSARDISRI